MGGGHERPLKRVVAATALAWLAVLGRPHDAGAHTTSTGPATLNLSGSPLSYGLTILPSELPAEAGQALVVALFLPYLLWMRGQSWEPRVVRAASVAVACVAHA